MSSLGERIKEVRNDNQLTQQNFASQISVSRPFISRIEANKEIPSESLLKLICATFNIDFMWLKDGVGDKCKPSIPYKQMQNEILNNQMLKNLVNLDDQKTFSFCCSILISILKNSNIKENSNLFYQEKVKSLLVNIDYYLKNTMLNYDNFNLSEPEELEFREKIEQEFLKNIYGNIQEASRAFFENDLNVLENE